MSKKSQQHDTKSVSSKETACSLPLLPEMINLTDQPRLADSRWNLDQTQTDFSDFSSDPLTGTEFLAGINAIKSNNKTSKKRTSSALTDPHYHPSKYTRVGSRSGANPSILKVKTSMGNILDARDLLVEAYKLTEDRAEQTNLLDLVEIFRKFTEKGHLGPLTTAVLNHQSAALPQPQPQQPPQSQTVAITTETTTTLTPKPTPASNAQPTYAEKLKASLPPSTSQSKPEPISLQGITQQPITNSKDKAQASPIPFSQNLDKIITLVTVRGSSLPRYQATEIRDKLNRVLGRRAIARVHTSPHHNLVLTCLEATADEVLESLTQWKPIFEGWPISEVQRVNNWPKLVVHGVPTCIPITSFKEEAEDYNPGLQIQGAPRWLLKEQKKAHSSVVFTVKSQEERQLLNKTGIIIGGMLLRVVNYQSKTHKTQCRNCLKFGHHASVCRSQPVCAICRSSHATDKHHCATCQSSHGCTHFAVKCVNCHSPSHNALQKHSCEVFKVLTC